MKSGKAKAKKPAPAQTRLRAIWKGALDWGKTMLFGFMMYLPIRVFVLQTYTVISGSMENTFLIGDFVVVNKVAYGATVPWTDMRTPGTTEPKRGDIVVFRSDHDDPPENIVKRLIGEPGDTIEMRDGTVLINGVALTEGYVQHIDPTRDDVIDAELMWQRDYLDRRVDRSNYFPSREDWGPIVVPAHSYFMMGDNRDTSYDSRYWGFVKEDEVIGRAEFIYFSWMKGDGPRFRRIGRALR